MMNETTKHIRTETLENGTILVHGNVGTAQLSPTEAAQARARHVGDSSIAVYVPGVGSQVVASYEDGCSYDAAYEELKRALRQVRAEIEGG